MARVMYLECFSGAAGDMLLGALIDAGLPVDALRDALGSLAVAHEITVNQVLRCGITATKFDVAPLGQVAGDDTRKPHTHGTGASARTHTHAEEDGHRSLDEIIRLVERSSLSVPAQTRAAALFRRLAQVEADIHGVPVNDVHLHEVGALDSIIDIAGAVFAMEWFGIDDIEASPLNVGSGVVDIAHGRFPVPAPATMRLLKGVPVYSDGPKMELVTPTGALLVSDYARRYGPLPAMTLGRVGYGAGTRDTPTSPNVLRVVIGDRMETAGQEQPSAVVQIEAEIDDMNPQLFGPATDRLFQAGALDVFLTPVFMKKGRPGTLLTVLAAPPRREGILDVIFRETTTIGVRIQTLERETLDRTWEEVAVPGGRVRIKLATRAGVVVNAVPEFDDCVKVAEMSGRPLKQVQADALSAWSRSSASGNG
ncbi:MAG: nickel pincer cofactor biosynthesis protein LarC [Acidobacteriota bacterium]